MKGDTPDPAMDWLLAKCYCCFPCKEIDSNSWSGNGGKSESVAHLQAQFFLSFYLSIYLCCLGHHNNIGPV